MGYKAKNYPSDGGNERTLQCRVESDSRKHYHVAVFELFNGTTIMDTVRKFIPKSDLHTSIFIPGGLDYEDCKMSYGHTLDIVVDPTKIQTWSMSVQFQTSINQKYIPVDWYRKNNLCFVDEEPSIRFREKGV